MPSLLGCYKPSPGRKHILCPVFSRGQWQSRWEHDSHVTASTVLFLSDLSPKLLVKSPSLSSVVQPSPRTLQRLAAAGGGQQGKCKLLPLEILMPIIVTYKIAAVIEGLGGENTCPVIKDCVCDSFQKRDMYFPHWMRKISLETVTSSTCHFPSEWFPPQLTPEKRLSSPKGSTTPGCALLPARSRTCGWLREVCQGDTDECGCPA